MNDGHLKETAVQRAFVKTAVGNRLGLFVALAFAWSWGCWLLSPVVKGQSSLLAAGLMWLGGFVPSHWCFCAK